MKYNIIPPEVVETPNPYQVKKRPLDTYKERKRLFKEDPLPFATLLKTQRDLNQDTRSNGLWKCLCRAHGGNAVIKSDGIGFRTENICVCKSIACVNCSIPRAKSMAEELQPIMEYCVIENDYDSFMLTTTHSKSLSIAKNFQ